MAEKSPTRVISLRLPVEEANKITQIAQAEDRTESAVVRRALRQTVLKDPPAPKKGGD